MNPQMMVRASHVLLVNISLMIHLRVHHVLIVLLECTSQVQGQLVVTSAQPVPILKPRHLLALLAVRGNTIQILVLPVLMPVRTVQKTPIPILLHLLVLIVQMGKLHPLAPPLVRSLQHLSHIHLLHSQQFLNLLLFNQLC